MVCLDIWHFMRRLACGCSSESHPLYATFMGKISNCTFEWDPSNVAVLRAAKREELANEGVQRPSGMHTLILGGKK